MEFDAKYSDEAYLVAYLGSTDSSSSKLIKDSIDAELDGEQMEIDENLTFASVGFGQGDGRTYYSAIVLGKVNVVEGDSVVLITGKANNLNIGAVSIIPVNKIEKEEETPDVNPPVDPAEPSKPDQPKKETNKGCGGSIIATASLVSMLALGGIAFLSVKRKED